jgi:kynurenine formamidase
MTTATADEQPTSSTRRLLDAALATRSIELGHPHFTGMPCSPNHPGFRMTLIRRHGDMVRPDGGSASNEIIVTGGHVGTHVDALSHVSHDGCLHGGIDAAEAQQGGSFSALGAEHTPFLLTRGVLLDVAATKGVDVLPAGYGVTADDLRQSAERAGVQPGQGDVALIRTGWARNFGDPATYLGQSAGVPGATVDAAEWLASAGVVTTGADTTAYEQIQPGAGHSILPVHRVLLVDAGIHIIDQVLVVVGWVVGVWEFLFVMAPLRIVGGTGSPIRPVAVVGA